MKTGIITTDSYLNHETGQGHPERADRVSVIIENLKTVNSKIIKDKHIKSVDDKVALKEKEIMKI